MNVKELRELLATLPDEMPVLIDAADFDYAGFVINSHHVQHIEFDADDWLNAVDAPENQDCLILSIA